MSALSPSQRAMLAQQRRRQLADAQARADAASTSDAVLRLEVELARESLTALGVERLAGYFIDTAGLAAWLRKSPGTLANWRSAGTGPQWRLAGGVAVYSIIDVLLWLREFPRGRRVHESPRYDPAWLCDDHRHG